MRKLLPFLCASFLITPPALACQLGDIVTKGSVDRSVSLDIIDSTDGTPETGVVFNTAGIDLWYRREGAAKTTITEATLAALTTAHSDGGFLHVSDGAYRLDLPDAAFATAANYVDIGGTVTGMVVICQRVRLVDYSLEDSVRMGLTGLANAVPGAAGGLQIAGSNAATTFATLTVTGATAFTGNVTMPAGLNITQSVSNTPALVITGNGTGNGATITSGSGATGTGLAVVSAATNGSAVTLTGVGTGNGMTATGGTTGHGISGVGGATSGNGIRATGTAGNSAALNLVGQGSAAGLLSTGGATGHGISAVGGATSGSGISSVASTSGAGIVATGVGTTQAGIAATGGSTSSAGISATAGGTGSGILATGGATGHGMRLVGGATSGNGISTSHTAPSAGACELGFCNSGTLSGTHSSTTADLGANAPGTVSDVVGHTITFPTRNLSRAITSYDTATGIATFATIDSDITLANSDPWILWMTAPGSAGGSAPTAAENAAAVWDLDATTHQTQGTFGQAIGDPAADTDTIFAKVNEIEDETDDIGAAGAGLTAADDSIMTRLGSPAGASVSADIADLPTNSELATSQAAADDATLAAIATAQTSVDDIPTNAELATSQASADDATLAAIAALNNLSAAQLRDTVIEDQGSTISLGCALAAILAYAGGDVATSAGTSTYEEPSGTETRIVGTVASAGNRTATITCPTY